MSPLRSWAAAEETQPARSLARGLTPPRQHGRVSHVSWPHTTGRDPRRSGRQATTLGWMARLSPVGVLRVAGQKPMLEQLDHQRFYLSSAQTPRFDADRGLRVPHRQFAL
jgi:hypothetical protein